MCTDTYTRTSRVIKPRGSGLLDLVNQAQWPSPANGIPVVRYTRLRTAFLLALEVLESAGERHVKFSGSRQCNMCNMLGRPLGISTGVHSLAMQRAWYSVLTLYVYPLLPLPSLNNHFLVLSYNLFRAGQITSSTPFFFLDDERTNCSFTNGGETRRNDFIKIKRS